jgi:hypothetical protein
MPGWAAGLGLAGAVAFVAVGELERRRRQS